MKLVSYIFLVFILNIISFSLKAQDPPYPTATIVSEDVAFCESGTATVEIEFTGTPPFAIYYEIDGSYGTEGFDEQTGLQTIDAYEHTFNLTQDLTADVNVLRVYDNNYQIDPLNHSTKLNSGSDLVSGSMNIQIDDKPTPNAGSDVSICGYEYALQGTVTDPDHTIYWNDMTGIGTYSDINSPTSTFTADQEGQVTFILKEINGACKDEYDEVTINFLGSPTAKLISDGEYKFCSTDAISDNVEFDVEFSGNAPFDYTVKTVAGSTINKSSSGLTDNFQYPVTSSDQYYIYSVTDDNGCEAPAEDITGTQIVTDLKPETSAGVNKIGDESICGTEFILDAVASASTTGIWTTNVSGISFIDATDANTTVASADYQLATLTWTETSNEMSCVSSDDVQIRFAEPPVLELLKTEDQICGDGTSVSYLTLKVANGNAPFTVTYNDETEESAEDILSLGNYTFSLNPSFNPSSSPQSLTSYHFTSIEGNYGCTTSYSDLIYNVYVDEMPVPSAGVDQLNMCDREIILNAEPSVGDGYWSLDSNGEFVDVNDPYTTFTAHNSGEYILKWNEVNGVCSDVDDVTITIQPSPYPVNAGVDRTIYALDNMQLNAETLTEGVGTWSLLEGNATIDDINSSTSIVTGMEPGVYRFLWSAVTTEGGCPAVEDEVVITMRELYETEGFSPNGDAVNEYFKIPGSENLNNVHFAVFDKFGKLKYEDTGVGANHEIKWDGIAKDGEELPEGVYYYIFDADELSKPVKKYLVIKR